MAKPPSKKPASPHEEPGQRNALRSWLAANRRDIRFIIVFALAIGLYYASTLTAPVKDWFFPAYLRLNARASGAILNTLGQKVTVDGQSIIAAGGPSIEIERGCDAVDPSALFVAAVIASPVPWLSKLGAAIAGTLALSALNLVRVVSLFVVRVHYPDAFDVMHLDVWQVVFIFMAILFWGLWASRAARRHTPQTDGAT